MKIIVINLKKNKNKIIKDQKCKYLKLVVEENQ